MKTVSNPRLEPESSSFFIETDSGQIQVRAPSLNQVKDEDTKHRELLSEFESFIMLVTMSLLQSPSSVTGDFD